MSTWLKVAMGTKMKEMRIDLAAGEDRGLTLIELLVAMAIGTAIVGVMSMSIASIMKITPLNNDRVITLTQVQNAGYWISRDVLGASSVTLPPPEGIFIQLYQKESSDDEDPRKVEYVFVDGTTLRREIDDAAPGTLIAQYVVVAETSFEAGVSSNSTYHLTVTAAKDEARPIQKTYDVTRRLSN